MDEKKAKSLLKKYSKDDKSFRKVLAHSKAVQRVALRYARKAKDCDVEFVKTASLLHDIGRFKCRPGSKGAIRHGVMGAKILRNEGLRKYAKVCERHIGAGIKKSDVKKQHLEIPAKEYMPKTIEEKIITHADNLVFGAKVGTFSMVKKRFKKELGNDYVERVEKLKKDIDKATK